MHEDYDEFDSVMTIMTPEERKYAYRNSQQISMQTGFIGYLRADLGKSGNEFYSTWNEFNPQLKTDEFKKELDKVINELRADYSMLHNRDALSKFCFRDPQAAMNEDKREFGYRLDMPKYTYMLRFNPYQGEYNLYCHCYVKERIDSHLKMAERGIRFIDPHYKEQFTIPDGDKIRITYQDGSTADRTCRYIDDYHLEVGSQVFHICEFAERMEQNGNEVIPIRSSLPEQCYIYLPTTREIGIVKKGESGYYRTDLANGEPAAMRELVDSMNKKLGVTKAQAEALKSGSMFGWKVPAADPKNYDYKGNLLKPKSKNKDYER